MNAETNRPDVFIRETWLSQRIAARSAIRAGLCTVFLAFGSFLYWQNLWNATQWMAADHDGIFVHKQWWRAWTTLFVHADAGHLISNASLFFIFGIFLIQYFGAFVFPFLAFIVGGLVNLIVLRTMAPQIDLIGASGVVYWMGAFWLVLYAYLERTKTPFERSLRAIGVGLLLFLPSEKFDPHISYKTHLVGFLLGLFCGWAYYKMNRRRFLAAEVKEAVFENPPIGSPPDGY